MKVNDDDLESSKMSRTEEEKEFILNQLRTTAVENYNRAKQKEKWNEAIRARAAALRKKNTQTAKNSSLSIFN